MNTINVEHLSFSGDVKHPLIKSTHEEFNDVSFSFTCGKCYCLCSDLGNGGWAFSWVLAGNKQQKTGSIYFDNIICKKYLRKRESQLIGIPKSNFLFSNRPIDDQIKNGLRNTKREKQYDRVIDLFMLDRVRINRSLDHVAAMRFRASMAIGYAYGNKLFCFPWMDGEWINDFSGLWLEKTIEVLKEDNCIILLPVPPDVISNYHFYDEVVKF